MGTNDSGPNGRGNRRRPKKKSENDDSQSDVDKRLNELDADRDPTSLAEELAKANLVSPVNGVSEQHFNMSDLQKPITR